VVSDWAHLIVQHVFPPLVSNRFSSGHSILFIYLLFSFDFCLALLLVPKIHHLSVPLAMAVNNVSGGVPTGSWFPIPLSSVQGSTPFDLRVRVRDLLLPPTGAGPHLAGVLELVWFNVRPEQVSRSLRFVSPL
jgi:hypothetical protein